MSIFFIFVASLPDPSFTKDKAHFARNLGLTDLAGGSMIINIFTIVLGWWEKSCVIIIFTIVGGVWMAVSQARRLLCCSPVLEDTSLGES